MAKKRSNKISTIGSKLSTVISVALVLLIVGILILISALTSGVGDNLRSRVSLVVRLFDDSSDDEIAALGSQLRAEPFAASVSYQSPDQILAQEVALNGDINDVLDFNPFTPEYEVYLVPAYVSADSVSAISERLLSISAVDEVYSPIEVVDSIDSSLRKVSLALSCIGVVFLLISMVLLVNTISLVIYSSRFLIHTMQLVGAKPSFVRRPFVNTGMAIGLLSGLLASLLLCGMHIYAAHTQMEGVFFVGWGTTALVCAAMVIIGVVLCGLASLFATNRFLRLSYDELYTK